MLSVALLAVSASALTACGADALLGCPSPCGMAAQPKADNFEPACCCKPPSDVTAAPTAQASVAAASSGAAIAATAAFAAPVVAMPQAQGIVPVAPPASGPPLARLCTFLI